MLSAERLTELFEEAGHEVRCYSGRFMFGKECPGVVFDSIGEVFAAVAEVTAAAATNEEADETDDVINAMRQVQTDSMGRGIIIYFPHIVYHTAAADEEE